MLTMGILGAVAIPRWGQALSKIRLEAATNRLLADLAAARTDAISTCQQRTIIFDIAQDQYSMQGLHWLSPVGTQTLVDLKVAPYCSQINSVDFNSTTQVTFDRFGAASHNGIIQLRNGSKTATIRVDAQTGKASLP